MNKNKLKDLIFIASDSVGLPEQIMMDGMSLDKYLYLQDDMLNPVIVIFSDYISKTLLNKSIFNIGVKKTEESLCFAKIIEDGDDDEDDTESEALRILIIMESMHQIFNLKNKSDLDLTNLVVNWRKSLESLDENEDINAENNIKNLIVKNIQLLKQKNEKRLTNE